MSTVDTSNSMPTRTLDDLIESLRHAEGQCVLLIGAGCSVTAGIPLARELVQEIQREYPRAYERASRNPPSATSALALAGAYARASRNPPSATSALALAGAYARASRNPQQTQPAYNAVMTQLSREERRGLLQTHIEKAKLNWAHLALAQLLSKKHVQLVLSVNFDPLLVQACGMVDFYPPIYDLAVTNEYHADRLAQNAILYLNGQHTGFVMLNSQYELEAHKTKLEKIVQDNKNALWVVVGYSGEADPLLQVLAKQAQFDRGLYWLGHSAQPSQYLQDSGLFKNGKYAHYIGAQDADNSLTTLAQRLDCFPPDILHKPIAHIQSMVEKIDFATGGEAAQAMQTKLKQRLETAAQSETPPQELSNTETEVSEGEVEKWLFAGEYERVIHWHQSPPALSAQDAQLELVAWAYIMVGNALQDEAQALAQRDDLEGAKTKWLAAGEKYQQALKFKPDMPDAANNWGIALAKEAQALVQRDDLEGAKDKWLAAGEKYEKALHIKPDKHEAANNWGNALDDEAQALAQRGNLDGAKDKWEMAGEKYEKALHIKPDYHVAADNWATSLTHLYHATAPAQGAVAFFAPVQNLLEQHAQMSTSGRESVAYNLACIYALQNDVARCLEQLEINRLSSFAQSRAHMEQDKDLDAVRQQPAFQAWWNKHFS